MGKRGSDVIGAGVKRVSDVIVVGVKRVSDVIVAVVSDVIGGEGKRHSSGGKKN